MTGKIFVLGATGAIGPHLIRALAAKGATVTAFVRSADKVEKLAGVTAVGGDIHDLAAFTAAVQGHERIFILTADTFNYAYEAKLAAAAVAAGVKHVVKLSAIDASDNAEVGSITHSHGVAEKAVLAAVPDTPVTILRPGFFIQNILRQAAEVKFASSLTSNYGQARVAFIDAADIADVAATVLTSPIDEYKGLSLTLTGPEALTWDEVVALLSKEIGKPIKAVDVDDATQVKGLVSHGLPRRNAWQFAHLGYYVRRSFTGNSFTTGNIEFVTGNKPRTVAQFFAQNRAAFL
ncbi:hypothetical protein HK105_205389 [Polyrhizophydium stewartii]|uniref:NmrA-like domain-containing protein n=1 Tax=Polyrhizophydium stewartii TaxID=2732419 RepID=A0ABR4N6I3_9FUNG